MENKKSLYYRKLEKKIVKCLLCPHECTLKDGKTGICMGRENSKGELYTRNYSLTTSLAVDPIEKKPLYHFYPGSKILSIGPNGCNLKCKFCQNWQVSQQKSETKALSSEELVQIAIEHGSIGIAYTYSEPFIWYEFLMDTVRLAREKGLKNVLVSNGFINEEPLKQILPFIDAMNIDVKSLDDSFYRKECQARLAPVLRCVEIAAKKCHVEVTNLIIPTLNDSDDNFKKLTDWLYEVNPDIPLHFSRYTPQYQTFIPTTSIDSLQRAFDIASKKMRYVYVGNVLSVLWNNTRCFWCKEEIIIRSMYPVGYKGFNKGRCEKCGKIVPIIGERPNKKGVV